MRGVSLDMLQITPLLALLLAVAAPVVFSSTENLLEVEKLPLELLLERDSLTAACAVMAQRQTQHFRNLPQDESYVSKQESVDGHERLNIIAHNNDTLWTQARSLCTQTVQDTQISAQDVLSSPRPSFVHIGPVRPPPLKISPLFRSGPTSNRVDLVFFSDGYLAQEEAKFIADAKRLVDDITNNHTFNTVKPLMNFWAAFTPSRESGVGVGGNPKDTPYGLYRDGTELRGVYYSKPEVARAACLSMGDRCDYPILMGNDPFYGGLGGEFTVITPSLANGALVLRHELGHSIIDVGEEYDGGFAYYGVNALNVLEAPIPWSHWLTSTHSHIHEPPSDNTARRRVERSVMPMQAYPWTMLTASVPWSVQFASSGQYARHLVRFSLSGLPVASDLSVTLDGKAIPWTPRPDIGVDRWHYDVHIDEVLAGGEHELAFELKNKELEGTAQLCSAEILEFGTEEEFVSNPGHYALYPTFSESNETSYRPTNEDCLMRVVTTPNFCRACLEGLWLSLLRRVDLIDTLSTHCEPASVASAVDEKPHRKRVFDVGVVPLGQFRKLGDQADKPKEKYMIVWTKDGVPLDAFKDQTHVEIDDSDAAVGTSRYAVDVVFTTDEVRVDPLRLLRSGGEFSVSSCNRA